MARWRDKNLDQMYELIQKESDEALETIQVRHWGALAETYLEQYHEVDRLITKLSEVWTSDAGDQYVQTLGKVKDQLYEAWSNSYDNAWALREIANQIGAAQTVIESLVISFNGKFKSAENAYFRDLERDKGVQVSDLWDDEVEKPERDQKLDDAGFYDGDGSYNDAAGRVMESTMQSIYQTYVQKYWIPKQYVGPLKSQEPSGVPPGMGMGGPKAPGMGAPSAPSMKQPALKPPALTPPQLKPPTTTPPPKPQVRPPGVQPPARPTVPSVTSPTTTPGGRPPTVTVPGVSRPGANPPTTSPATSRPSAVRPSAPSAPSVGGVPGKPPAGKMAPPPSALSPKGGTKPAKPGKGGRNPGAPGTPGVPGKPGSGKMAPPVSGIRPKGSDKTAKQPGTPGRPGTPGGGTPPGVPGRGGSGGKPGIGMAGKPAASDRNRRTSRPGSPDAAKGPFAPTPHIGSRRTDKPKRPEYGAFGGKGIVPPAGVPGRVTRGGGSKPVLTGRGPTQPPHPNKGLGVPPSLTSRGKAQKVGKETAGVIRPAEERQVTVDYSNHKRDIAKLRERMKNPAIAELIKSKHKMIGLPMPVIDAPEPEKDQSAGPVLGYRAKA